jgi:putative nucleotidyltransferase with HDIG domain
MSNEPDSKDDAAGSSPGSEAGQTLGELLVGSDFLAVPTQAFMQRDRALTDVYVRMPSGKMIRVFKKDQAFDLARLKRFGDKSVDYLFIARSDFSSFMSELIKTIEQMNREGRVSVEKRMEILNRVSESVYAEMLRLPLDIESLNRTLRVCAEISNAVTKNTSFTMVFDLMVGIGESFARHSMAVVYTANLLAQRLGWTSPLTVEPLTRGAFMHDIGFRELPAHIREKDKAKMTPDELALYQQHPALGVELLQSFQIVGSEAIRIVQDHHELPNGTGFPGKLKGEKIFPLAKVVSLADVIAHEMIDSSTGEKLLSAAEMSVRLERDYTSIYGGELIRAARGMMMGLK